jgi:hypothetical protein
MAQADTSIIPAVGDEPQQPPPSADSPNRPLVWIFLLAGLAIFLLAYIIAAVTAGSGVRGARPFSESALVACRGPRRSRHYVPSCRPDSLRAFR